MKNSEENLVRGIPLMKGYMLSGVAAIMSVSACIPLFQTVPVWYTVGLGVSAILWFVAFVWVERMLVDTWNTLQIAESITQDQIIDAVISTLDKVDGTKEEEESKGTEEVQS